MYFMTVLSLVQSSKRIEYPTCRARKNRLLSAERPAPPPLVPAVHHVQEIIRGKPLRIDEQKKIVEKTGLFRTSESVLQYKNMHLQ
jgi:hypothetical protein